MRNLDNTLYNGGQMLGESLSEYTLKNEDDPGSLHEISEDGEEFFVDKIDEESNEIFFISAVYVQIRVFPETFDPAPQIIAKTATLNDLLLPFSQDAYQSARTP